MEGNEGEGYFIGWGSSEERGEERNEGLKLHRKRDGEGDEGMSGERIFSGTKTNWPVTNSHVKKNYNEFCP